MSKIAISNLAWAEGQDQQILELLRDSDVQYLEISPFRSSGNESVISKKAAQSLMKTANQYGIRIIALQALLFRHPELTLFDSKQGRRQTLRHLKNLCDYAVHLDATKLVFGSPKNKLRNGLSYKEASSIAKDFFAEAAEYAAQRNLTICLEPTPSVYGADFVRDTKEAIGLIDLVRQPALKLNLDIGSLITNKEDPEQVIVGHASKIGHVHVSEPRLRPINPDKALHANIASLLANTSYKGVISIEMLPQPDNNEAFIKEAITFVQSVYSKVSTRQNK